MDALALQPLLPLPGIAIGHYTDLTHGTGCTAILCPEGAVGGVDVRGGAPGTRETALLDPTCKVSEVHGVALAGGSAFGLATADGVMRWLAEQGCGYDTGMGRVPIVPAAIVFDLGVGPLQGNRKPAPSARNGYEACQRARQDDVAEGCVGAGAGSTVGKFLGLARCSKGGLGCAAWSLPSGLKVGALVVVNALGNVVADGRILAGARHPATNAFVDIAQTWAAASELAPTRLGNTTVGAVITNARLTKAEAAKVAQMAQAGIARRIRPSHTPHDGDTLFALCTRQVPADAGQVGTLAARAVAAAIRRAVEKAHTLFDIPAASDV